MPRTFTHKLADATASPQSFAATSRPQERGAMKSRGNLVRLFALGIAGLTWAGISDAAALDFPTRPVRIIVGFAPGGGSDILVRPIAQWLTEKTGPAVHRREPARRQHQSRHRDPRQLAARRLHPAGAGARQLPSTRRSTTSSPSTSCATPRRSPASCAFPTCSK